MKIYPNPNFPHSVRRESTQTVSQKHVAYAPTSVDALMSRNADALTELQYRSSERTKRRSS